MGGWGFVSGGRSWGGSVVLRASRSGWVWGLRVARSAPGSWPAAACVFVPFASRARAVGCALGVARSLGWRCWVRGGRRCPGAAFEVKVALPPGLSARAARALLPSPAGAS